MPGAARAQELQAAHAGSSGQVPRSIEVELRGALVDPSCAGAVVTLLGLVSVINTEGEAGKQLHRLAWQADALARLPRDAMHAGCPPAGGYRAARRGGTDQLMMRQVYSVLIRTAS